MKKVILILALLVSSSLFSQLVTTNPDTVCFQSTALSTYAVQNIGSGTYTWTIPGSVTLVSGQGTNSIQIGTNSQDPKIYGFDYYGIKQDEKIFNTDLRKVGVIIKQLLLL